VPDQSIQTGPSGDVTSLTGGDQTRRRHRQPGRLAAAGHPLVTAILAVVAAALWFALTYWILMGATAIIVLAGARILDLPAALPAVKAAAGFVEGFSFALRAFGTWWIPLGMYSVATLTFGKTAHLAFMAPLSRFTLWVALAAWVAVAGAAVARIRPTPEQP
jgi:hypothetical protein